MSVILSVMSGIPVWKKEVQGSGCLAFIQSNALLEIVWQRYFLQCLCAILECFSVQFRVLCTFLHKDQGEKAGKKPFSGRLISKVCQSVLCLCLKDKSNLTFCFIVLVKSSMPEKRVAKIPVFACFSKSTLHFSSEERALFSSIKHSCRSTDYRL